VIIFSMLVSLFERAYLLLYDEAMSPKRARRWRSWEDYMREWYRRRDFQSLLPQLLPGEDPQFAQYIRQLAERETTSGGRAPGPDTPATQRLADSARERSSR
jgi:hypothetical protein